MRESDSRLLIREKMATAAIPRPRGRRHDFAGRVGGRATVPDVYFVKRIDNSRRRREVDPEKQHECYSLLGLGILVLLFCLLLARQHFQHIRYGYQIQELKAQRVTLEEWNRRLRLDEACLADPQRIDAYARQKLGLAPPAPQQVIHIGPASSVPASDPVLARVLPATGPGVIGLGSGEPGVHREP
jgi:cell division protein FtsL